MLFSKNCSRCAVVPNVPDGICYVFTDVRDMGKVAGAVVGISLGVLVVILIIWLVFRTKEKKKYEEEETPNEIRFVLPPFHSYLFFYLCLCSTRHV